MKGGVCYRSNRERHVTYPNNVNICHGIQQFFDDAFMLLIDNALPCNDVLVIYLVIDLDVGKLAFHR